VRMRVDQEVLRLRPRLMERDIQVDVDGDPGWFEVGVRPCRRRPTAEVDLSAVRA